MHIGKLKNIIIHIIKGAVGVIRQGVNLSDAVFHNFKQFKKIWALVFFVKRLLQLQHLKFSTTIVRSFFLDGGFFVVAWQYTDKADLPM